MQNNRGDEEDSRSSGEESSTVESLASTLKKQKSYTIQKRFRDRCSLCCLDQPIAGNLNLHLDDICEDGCMICQKCSKSPMVNSLLAKSELNGRKCPICRSKLLDLKVLLGRRTRFPRQHSKAQAPTRLDKITPTRRMGSVSAIEKLKGCTSKTGRDPALEAFLFDALGELSEDHRPPNLRQLVREMVKVRNPNNALLQARRGTLRLTMHDAQHFNEEEIPGIKDVILGVKSTIVQERKGSIIVSTRRRIGSNSQDREKDLKNHSRVALGLSQKLTGHEIMDFIADVYAHKADVDDVSDLNNSPRISIPTFVLKHVQESTASLAHAQDKLVQVIDAVERFALQLPRVKVFGVMTGLLPELAFKVEVADMVLELLRTLFQQEQEQEQEMNYGTRIKRRLTNKRVAPTVPLSVAYKALEFMSTTGRFSKIWLMSSLRPVCTELGMQMPWEGNRMDHLKERIKVLSITSSQRLQHKAGSFVLSKEEMMFAMSSDDPPKEHHKAVFSKSLNATMRLAVQSAPNLQENARPSTAETPLQSNRKAGLQSGRDLTSGDTSRPQTSHPEKKYINIDQFIEACISEWLFEENTITELLGRLLRPYVKLPASPSLISATKPVLLSPTTPAQGKQDVPNTKPTKIKIDAHSEHLNRAKNLPAASLAQAGSNSSRDEAGSDSNLLLNSKSPKQDSTAGLDDAISIGIASISTQDDDDTLVSEETDSICERAQNQEVVEEFDWEQIKKHAQRAQLPKGTRHNTALRLAKKMGIFMHELSKGAWQWQNWKWHEEWEWGALLVENFDEKGCQMALDELGESSDSDDDLPLQPVQENLGNLFAVGLGINSRANSTFYRAGTALGQDHRKRNSRINNLNKAFTEIKDSEVPSASMPTMLPPKFKTELNNLRRSSTSGQEAVTSSRTEFATSWIEDSTIISGKPSFDMATDQQLRTLQLDASSLAMHINLSHYSIGNKSAVLFSENIRNSSTFSDIQSLNLEGNLLNEKSTLLILQALAETPSVNLVSLNMSKNRIDDKGALAIAVLLKKELCRFKSLNLADTQLKDVNAGIVCQALLTQRTLVTLILSKNSIQGKNKQIATMLSENITMRELDLSWNELRSVEANYIFKTITDANTTLTALNVSYNPFGNMGIQQLEELLLVGSSVIKKIDISYVGLQPKHVGSLRKILESNSSLLYLNISGNLLGAELVETLEKQKKEAFITQKRAHSLCLIAENCAIMGNKLTCENVQMQQLYEKYNFHPQNFKVVEKQNKESKGGKTRVKTKK